MSTPPLVRPLLLGYLRATVAQTAGELRRAYARLEEFARREDFCLGPVFVDRGEVGGGAFASLLEELGRNEAVRGIVIPDHRHLTCEEQLVLSRHEHGSRTPVLTVDSVPWSGGPGAASPECAGSASPSELVNRLFRRLAVGHPVPGRTLPAGGPDTVV